MTSKFIGHFLEDISAWQKTLSIVDQVISLWFDVQRTWSHLESIFVGSEDIRLQLPKDSERFDDTNQKFQKKIKLMSTIPNVIEATAIPGLAEELEVILSNSFTFSLKVIQSALSLCEKALAEYLETKRLAFPRSTCNLFFFNIIYRFYFASAVDLLDILSNGEIPFCFTKMHYRKSTTPGCQALDKTV